MGVRTEGPIQPFTVFVNFQTLSSIINRPSSINSWLITELIVDKVVLINKETYDGSPTDTQDEEVTLVTVT